MAESILLLIILLIIIAISIGFYLYTQQNTTDDKTFSEREQKIIDKATTNSQTIITKDISTKLDDGNYVKTDHLTDDRLNIESNQKKIAEITSLRTTGDKGYTATTSTGETEGDSGDSSVGSYQYIMQNTEATSDEKIELRNKVNIASDFNICNEEKNVCYKFTVDQGNLNIVKTDISEDVVTEGNGKIFFKNGFELYNQDDATTENKYFEGPHPDSFYIATPSALNNQSFETQQSVYDIINLRKQFLISNAIAVKDDDSEKSKQNLDTDNQYYIKINTGGDSDSNNYEYHIMYPFSKLLQPILEYTDPDDGQPKQFTMDYTNDILKVLTLGSQKLVDTIPASMIQVNLHPKTNTPTTGTLNITIRYIVKTEKKSVDIS